jgi:hypothetical protein
MTGVFLPMHMTDAYNCITKVDIVDTMGLDWKPDFSTTA